MQLLFLILLLCSVSFAKDRPLAHRSGVVEFGPEEFRGDYSPLDLTGDEVQMNQDVTTNRQNEITMASWILNPRLVMGGSNDYRNSDASGGFYVSIDGGETFYDALVTRGPEDEFEAAGDPVAAIDRTGKLYATYIAFDRTTNDGGIYTQTSVDSGVTWSDPAVIIEHLDNSSVDFEDKPYTCADLSPSSPYVNTHYVTWTSFRGFENPIFVSRSTDGGATYSEPLRISTSGDCQFSCPTTGPNGEVYVVFINYSNGNIKFDRSFDGGVTWGPDVTVSTITDLWFAPNPCGSFRTPNYPVISCDISGGPRNGWLYVSWVDLDSSLDPNVMFCRSTDQGVTWSEPVRVDDGPEDTWQWWHWMTVHPETGSIGFAWLDRRDDPAGCLYKPYATISFDGGETFAPSIPISDVLCDPRVTNFLGDYNGATFRHDRGFYYGWVDTRNDGGDAYSNWFSLDVPAPQDLVVTVVDDDAHLFWRPVDSSIYHVLYSFEPGGPYESLVGITPDTFIVDTSAFTTFSKRFYVVKAVPE
ncbi:MAG: exo-alpha-sialidase [Calditrichaeota bacterium]|nr:exo-alpha-sialidase [Calditrichota bacterium]